MKKQKIRAKRNKKYNPKAFPTSNKEMLPPKPLWKKILKIFLIVIGCLLLILAIIGRIRHFFVKHWQQ